MSEQSQLRLPLRHLTEWMLFAAPIPAAKLMQRYHYEAAVRAARSLPRSAPRPLRRGRFVSFLIPVNK